MTNQTPESVIAEAMVNAGAPLMHSRVEEGVAAALRAANMLREPGMPEPSESERESVINAVLNRLDEMNNGEISYGVYSELHDLVSSIPALPPPPARDEWEYRCTNEQNSVPLSVSPESHREHCSGVIERRRKAGPWEPLPVTEEEQ